MSDEERPLSPSLMEQYARENPAGFARAMGNEFLALCLEGRPPRPWFSLLVLEAAREKRVVDVA